jgi:hypothetical protein
MTTHGPKVQYEPCDVCGRPKVALYPVDGKRICLDCYQPKPREEEPPRDTRPLRDRLLEVLGMYATPSSWGRVNRDRPSSYFRAVSVPGWMPAARILEELLEAEAAADPDDGSWRGR